MNAIPDSVFLIIGIIALILLFSIYNIVRQKYRVKRRPKGMSFNDITYHRSRYLSHARHFRKKPSQIVKVLKSYFYISTLFLPVQ